MFVGVVIYFLIFAAVTAVTLANSEGKGWVLTIWAWVGFNLPTMLLLFIFLKLRVRVVGPLVLIFMIVEVVELRLTAAVLTSNQESFDRLTGPQFIGVLLLGGLIACPIGWLILRLIRHQYERKKLSDQSITRDAILLLLGFGIP